METPTSESGASHSCLVSRNEKDNIYVSMFAVLADNVEECHMAVPLSINFFTWESCCQSLIKLFLRRLGIPQTFYNYPDCEMVQNIFTMLTSSMLQHEDDVGIDYYTVFLSVSKISCAYNVVNCFCESGPTVKFVESLACESGRHASPAGAGTLKTLKIQDEEDNCSICLQGFSYGSESSYITLFSCIS